LETKQNISALTTDTGVERNHIIVNDPCNSGPSHFYLSQIHGQSHSKGIVMGQKNELIGNTKNSIIAGGFENIINNNSDYCFIGGGNNNAIGGGGLATVNAFIGGGQGNTASGDYSSAFGQNADAKQNNSAVFGLDSAGTSAPAENTLTVGVGDLNPDRGIYYKTAPTGATGAALSVRDDGQIVVPDQLLMANGSELSPAYSFGNAPGYGMYYAVDVSALGFCVNGSAELVIQSNALRPAVNNGLDLGTTSQRFQNIYSNRTLLEDGSQSAPSYSFRNDSSIGMYYTSEGVPLVPRINLNTITHVYGRGHSSGDPYLAIATRPLSSNNFGNVIAPNGSTLLSRFDMYQQGNATSSNRRFIMKFNSTNNGIRIDNGGGFVPDVDNTMVLGSSCRRWIQVYATIGIINTSDQTLKKDISDISEEDSIKFISGLTPKKYNFINPNSNKEGYLHYGLMSQDVKTCMQSCNFNDFGGYVEEPMLDDDGNETGETFYGLRYSSFIPPMIKSIQSLSKSNKKIGMNENTNNSKNNIKNENIGLSFINELRPVTYDMDDTKHHGLVIDEVKSTLDTLSIPMEEIGIINGVSGMSGCYEINYKELVTPLIKAVQELSARVATLEALQS